MAVDSLYFRSLFAILFVLFLSTLSSAKPIQKFKDQEIYDAYDFVICGGGTAGLVLANRLSESGKFTVLVLEAGPEPTTVAAYETPGGNQFLKGSSIDWAFTTEPQEGVDGRILQYLRGRALGGSSTTNGLYYARGSASVYDRWEQLGNPGWSWDEVYPLFIKSTHINPPIPGPQFEANSSYKTYDPAAYGDGPLQVGFQGYVTDSTIGFVQACEAANIPIVEDLNTGNGVGVKVGTANLDSRLRRSSSYDSFYRQAQGRPNLHVLHQAPVTSLSTEAIPGGGNGTAQVKVTSVSFVEQSTSLVHQVKANKEVILSMGAFHSPQMLMLSGIGPAEELAKFNIEPAVINENVGRHLNDHHVFSIMATVRPESSTTQMGSSTENLIAAQEAFYNNLEGPYTAPSGVTNGFQELSNEELEAIGAGEIVRQGLVNQSHVEYLFETVWYPWVPTKYYAPSVDESYISLTASSMVSLSRGQVSLRSNSYTDQPIIDPKYYTHPADRAVAVQAFKYLRKILAHPALSQFTVGPNNGEVSPGAAVSDDDEEAIFDYIKSITFPNWHASGTCQMGPSEADAVVDPKLKVYGVEGLRIADCSIIPDLPDANIIASVYMIAEKAAQMIREEWGDN